MLCSPPNRGALRRQARVAPLAQEQLGDPWVRLSDRSVKQTSSDRVPAEAHVGATMSTEENLNPELDSTVRDEVVGAPPDVTSENSTPAPLSKKGPPVAPKPTWFRHSRRKVQEEPRPNQNLDKTPEQKPSVSSGRGFRSHGANLSLKQKIHSFENFSSQISPDREARRPLVTSSSIPLGEKQPRHRYGLHDWKEPPKEKTNVAALLKEADETLSKPKIPDGSAVTSEAPVLASKSDRSPLNSAEDLPDEVRSTAPLSGLRCGDSSTSPSKEQKAELSEKSGAVSGVKVVFPETPGAPSHPEEESSPGGREGLSKQVPADIHHSQRDPDEETKILHLSHKVKCSNKSIIHI